jgi:hypothetical protein
VAVYKIIPVFLDSERPQERVRFPTSVSQSFGKEEFSARCHLKRNTFLEPVICGSLTLPF